MTGAVHSNSEHSASASTIAASQVAEQFAPLSVAIYLADQNPHRDRSLGITSMTRAVMTSLAAFDDVSITQIVSRSSISSDESAHQTLRLPFRTDNAAGRLIADTVHPWLVRTDAAVWYYPKGYVPRLPPRNKPLAGTMHDTIVQYYADNYPNDRSSAAFRYWINATRRSLEHLDCVMTISEYSAQQLRSFCERYQIRIPPIEITYEGSVWETLLGTVFPKGDYVVHLASTSPHKQSNRLLRLWMELQQKRTDLPELVFVGLLDDAGTKIYQGSRGIKLLPRQSTSELQELVGGARALILPSEIEGFGLPALEAYYAGTPVCYSSETSVDEIMSDAGKVGSCDFNSLDSFVAALDQVCNLDDSAMEGIKLDLYARFSMHSVAQRMLAAWTKLL